MILVVFFRFWDIKLVCIFVALCDPAHDVETIHGQC